MKDIITRLPVSESKSADVLQEILRSGAQKMLQQAIEAEVADYLSAYSNERDENGYRLVTRNGRSKSRNIQTGIGDVEVSQPRVNDRRISSDGVRQRFQSSILPPYLRRTKSIEELLPFLYLKGISTGDFSEALSVLLGTDAPGLSASTIVRLKEVWTSEFSQWNKRALEDKNYVYIWADGVHFNVRLEEDRLCVLVIIGATEDGKKELIAVHEGYRESAMSWKEVLLDLRDRGLSIAPKLAIADGALGFWSALEEVYPETKRQGCWVHKTANVLDKLPKSKQPQAKRMIHDIYLADTEHLANEAFDRFIEVFEPKHIRAVECLKKNRENLMAFYSFPAQHWLHLRTTNPIESMFATVRLRTKRTKGCGSSQATMAMVFKLAMSAQKRWRRLNSAKLTADVIDARFIFEDGIRKDRAA